MGIIKAIFQKQFIPKGLLNLMLTEFDVLGLKKLLPKDRYNAIAKLSKVAIV